MYFEDLQVFLNTKIIRFSFFSFFFFPNTADCCCRLKVHQLGYKRRFKKQQEIVQPSTVTLSGVLMLC